MAEVLVKVAADLFELFDSVYNKKDPGEYLYYVVLNRWLASGRDLAGAAREISNASWDDKMTWQFWRAALPRMAKAPTLRWPAPKKPPEAEALMLRLMEVHNVRREVAEEMESLLAPSYHQLLHYYGVEKKK